MSIRSCVGMFIFICWATSTIMAASSSWVIWAISPPSRSALPSARSDSWRSSRSARSAHSTESCPGPRYGPPGTRVRGRDSRSHRRSRPGEQRPHDVGLVRDVLGTGLHGMAGLDGRLQLAGDVHVLHRPAGTVVVGSLVGGVVGG